MGQDLRRHVRGGFDRAAEEPQRTRPVCPSQLFDDLLRVAGLTDDDRALKIGCGSRTATLSLAARGLAVTVVELGLALAAIARRQSGFPVAAVVSLTARLTRPS